MITVKVYMVKGKTYEYKFHTQPEAIAFTAGLRLIDGLNRGDRMLSAELTQDSDPVSK